MTGSDGEPGDATEPGSGDGRRPDGEPGGASRGESGVTGVDIARRALEEARAKAAAEGKAVGKGNASPSGARRRRYRPGGRSNRRRWSGPAPDGRDPQTLGALAASLAKRRGWSEHVAEGTVLGCWDQVVGGDIAEHAAPTALRGKVLHVTAESTAWATQLRMMQSQILAKIAKAVGHGVVTRLDIRGPAAPSWRHGQLHVSGRGPRDTYG